MRTPDTQFFLALSAFLLVVAATPRTVISKAFDAFVVALSGLSGPFCIPLTLIALCVSWRSKEMWRWVPAAILAIAAVIQIWSLFFLDPAARPHASLGASIVSLIRILGGQVFLGALLGSNAVGSGQGLFALALLSGASIVGVALIFACAAKSRSCMRFLLLFSTALLLASLAFPAGCGVEPCWTTLYQSPGLRYWFFPMLLFIWSLLWLWAHSRRVLKTISTALLCAMLFGIIRDWEIPSFALPDLPVSAGQFEESPAGAHINIPISPPGWKMTLIKRHTM